MPFVDLIDEKNKRISINTDYVIMVGETTCGHGYIVDTNKATTYTNQEYQDVLNAIKSALAPTKKK